MGKYLCKKKDYNRELYEILRGMINSEIDKEVVYKFLKLAGFKLLDNPLKYSYEEAKIRKKLINPIISEQQKLEQYFSWFSMAFSQTKDILDLKNPESRVTFNIIFSKIKTLRTLKSKAARKKPNDLKFYTNMVEVPESFRNFYEIKRDELEILAEDFDLGQSFNSCTETGLRQSYNSDTLDFLNAVLRGVPPEFRWISWTISAKVPLQRKNEDYLKLIKSDIPLDIDMQIKKDVGRTLAFTEVFFQNAVNQKSLYNILKAIATCDPELGYCTGMNNIAGFFLIVSNFNEIDSFYMMVSFLSKNYTSKFCIRGLFLDGFPLLHLMSYQFDILFKEHMPGLYKHFHDVIRIPEIAWIDNWIQTIFTICFPLHIAVRLWDAIITNGLKYSLNIALAYLMKHEKDLKRCMNIDDVLNYFISISKNTYHINVSAQSILDIAKKIKIDDKYLNELKSKFEKTEEISLDCNVYYKITSAEREDTEYVGSADRLNKESQHSSSKNREGDNFI